jgi:5'-methylthioadenosine phosphorylase
MLKIGIISGSGLYEIPGLEIKKRRTVKTPFGRPSDKYIIGLLNDVEVAFLPRHGGHHNIPPHMINYRANIWGFKELEVHRIISVSAVGGITKGLKPGDIVVLDQIIDMTRTRKSTFYDGKTGVVHIDLTDPFCPDMRELLLRAGKRSRIALKDRGTYTAVDGPRLETAAEIRAFGKLGGDVVGMTGMPEASLARESEICYSGLTVVANFAAGLSKKKLTTAEVMQAMKASTEKIKRLLKETIKICREETFCSCQDALKEAKI